MQPRCFFSALSARIFGRRGIRKFQHDFNFIRSRLEADLDMALIGRSALHGLFANIFDGGDQIRARAFSETRSFRDMVHRTRDSGQQSGIRGDGKLDPAELSCQGNSPR